MSGSVKESLKAGGISVNDDMADVVAEAMIDAFANHEGEITAETVKEYFNDYANILKTEYEKIFEVYTSLRNANLPDESGSVNVEQLEAAKESFQTAYRSFIRRMVDLRIEVELEPCRFECDEQKAFILSHCGLVDYWYNQIVSKRSNDSGDKFMMQIQQHLPIIDGVINKSVDVVKLINGEYSKEDLDAIVNECK
jgi:hypothetical protein